MCVWSTKLGQFFFQGRVSGEPSSERAIIPTIPLPLSFFLKCRNTALARHYSVTPFMSCAHIQTVCAPIVAYTLFYFVCVSKQQFKPMANVVHLIHGKHHPTKICFEYR